MNCRGPLQMCVVMAAFISLSYSYDGSDPLGSEWFRRLTSGYAKRVTVFDRMGRYYGKRSSTETDDGFRNQPSPLYTVEDMQDQISSSPRFLTRLIRGYIDKNGDDLIDEDEIADMKQRILDI